MNHMNKVAEMLGVEMNKEFHIKDTADTYILNEYGLSVISEGHNESVNASDFLTLLLSGQLEVIREPWKPKNGENFYTISVSIDNEVSVYGYVWRDNSTCNELYALGNCFRTKEEARRYKDEYMKWLKNKEPDISWRE